MGFKQELIDFSQVKVSFGEQMKKHTSLGVGGNAEYFAYIDTLYGLNKLLVLAKEYKIPFKIIGNGTNILVADGGFEGLIISLKGLNDVFFKRDFVKVMAGATIDKLSKFCIDHKLSGMEALSGIPATVGGAIVMNAGAFGNNISDHVVSVQTLCGGKIKTYDKSECKFGYRKSRFLGGKEVVISATFSFREGVREVISASVKNYAEIRKSMQPLGRSCGSVFKNPKDKTAGFLIECAGLKGQKIGGASISTVHGNFIMNEGKATANDVFLLINYIKDKIKKEFGITLTEEVELIGEF
ncbi:MAG: UDP-N-acetylmuramate dehydrogenase [Clostridiales bacterium]|nr:UDP-N-acetylmuramate dehydrogenase [Clostridiales bacterium]